MTLNLEEIWKIQRELNILVGFDTFGDPEKEKLFHNYAKLLHEEIIELFNCCYWDDQFVRSVDFEKAKIEAIACMYRLISLLHIVMKSPISEKADSQWEHHWKRFKNEYFVNVSRSLFDEKTKDLLIYSTRLISLKEINSQNIELIKSLIGSITDRLMQLFGILNFEIEDILKSYKTRYEEIKDELQWDDKKIKKYIDDFLEAQCH